MVPDWLIIFLIQATGFQTVAHFKQILSLVNISVKNQVTF